MAYTEPPDFNAGDIWDRDDVQTYIIDNIKALFDLLSLSGSALTLEPDDLVVGTSEGTLGTLSLDDGDLVTARAGAISALAPADDGDILELVSGAPTWESPPAPSIDHISYFIFGG